MAKVGFCFRSQRVRAFTGPALSGLQEPPPEKLRRLELLSCLSRLLEDVCVKAAGNAEFCDIVQAVHARFFLALNVNPQERECCECCAKTQAG